MIPVSISSRTVFHEGHDHFWRSKVVSIRFILALPACADYLGGSMKAVPLVMMLGLLVARPAAGLEWPVAQVVVTATFGESRGDHFHAGIDLGGGVQEVLPIAAGEVVFAHEEGEDRSSVPVGLGSFLVLQHKGGVRSIYGHLEAGSMPRGEKSFDGSRPLGKVGCHRLLPGQAPSPDRHRFGNARHHQPAGGAAAGAGPAEAAHQGAPAAPGKGGASPWPRAGASGPGPRRCWPRCTTCARTCPSPGRWPLTAFRCTRTAGRSPA